MQKNKVPSPVHPRSSPKPGHAFSPNKNLDKKAPGPPPYTREIFFRIKTLPNKGKVVRISFLSAKYTGFGNYLPHELKSSLRSHAPIEIRQVPFLLFHLNKLTPMPYQLLYIAITWSMHFMATHATTQCDNHHETDCTHVLRNVLWNWWNQGKQMMVKDTKVFPPKYFRILRPVNTYNDVLLVLSIPPPHKKKC